MFFDFLLSPLSVPSDVFKYYLYSLAKIQLPGLWIRQEIFLNFNLTFQSTNILLENPLSSFIAVEGLLSVGNR